ncbi:MAG: DUF1876 domain-containing protein [Frankiales bacterium]|nr:DUF1876 domain-containing protein [Frankiales bacterium]
MSMRGSVGDRVFAATARDGHLRSGRILALRHPDGSPPYVVRWDDSNQSTVWFPRGQGEPVRDVWPAAPTDGTRRRMKSWRVDVELVEDGTETTALALLHEDDDGTVVVAEGHSQRNPHDTDVPEIGDELAVSRALTLLATTLARTIDVTISDVEHRKVHVPGAASSVDLR